MSIATRVETTRSASALPVIARLEAQRYLRHPLFLFGVVVNITICLVGPDPHTSVALNGLGPAAATGVLGIVIMVSLTRSSETIGAAAGVVPLPERTRSLALVGACLVPLALGLLWWLWAVVTFHHHPPPANGYPFGTSEAWNAAVMFGQGPLATFGGPLLGVVVGRWTKGRGAVALTSVGVVAVTIVMQGLFEPLRRIRVVMPWTHWGGPYGVDGDPNRMLVFSGSPFWWIAYVACLCALGVLAVLLHDREQPRRRLAAAAAGIGIVAVATVLLAMGTGTSDTVVNPLPSS